MEGDPKSDPRPKPLGFGPVDKPFDAVKSMPNVRTVTMTFVRRVLLLRDGRYYEFQPGVQEVPVVLADDWYLKQMGATRYEPSPAAPPPAAPTEEGEDGLTEKERLERQAFNSGGREDKPAKPKPTKKR